MILNFYFFSPRHLRAFTLQVPFHLSAQLFPRSRHSSWQSSSLLSRWKQVKAILNISKSGLHLRAITLLLHAEPCAPQQKAREER